MNAIVTVLVLGDTERGEFQDALEALNGCHVVRSPDVERGLARLLQEQLAPAAIVLVQGRPGEHAVADIDRLRRAAPLAPIVGLLGTWCEGEARSLPVRPTMARLVWHQWGARGRRDVRRLLAGACPDWGLPLTATPEERLLRWAAGPLPRRQGLVAVCAAHEETSDWLRSACRHAGYETVCLAGHAPDRVRGLRAGIWMAAGRLGAWTDELRAFAGAVGPAPVLAVLDFPRAEDRDRATAAGATAVLAQPVWLEDLFWELGRMAGEVSVE